MQSHSSFVNSFRVAAGAISAAVAGALLYWWLARSLVPAFNIRSHVMGMGGLAAAFVLFYSLWFVTKRPDRTRELLIAALLAEIVIVSATWMLSGAAPTTRFFWDWAALLNMFVVLPIVAVWLLGRSRQ